MHSWLLVLMCSPQTRLESTLHPIVAGRGVFATKTTWCSLLAFVRRRAVTGVSACGGDVAHMSNEGDRARTAARMVPIRVGASPGGAEDYFSALSGGASEVVGTPSSGSVRSVTMTSTRWLLRWLASS